LWSYSKVRSYSEAELVQQLVVGEVMVARVALACAPHGELRSTQSKYGCGFYSRLQALYAK